MNDIIVAALLTAAFVALVVEAVVDFARDVRR